MKKLAFGLAVLGFSAISFASSMGMSMLLPADDSMCQGDLPLMCEEGLESMRGSDGRCGCVDPAKLMPIERCMVAMIRCNEGSSLSYMKPMGFMGMGGDMATGCGCFGTMKR
jgi:hypothetical protein